MLRAIVLCLLYVCVLCEDSRVVNTTQGPIRGHRSSTFDGFVFYNVPYATAPTGRDKFKEPGPPPVWEETYDAVDRQIICPQPNIFGEIITIPYNIQEDCLIANIYVPNVDEVLPVVVFVHGGAYILGYGDMISPENMAASKKAIFITFNYRLAGHGFLCLGTEDIPGNTGMKDQVAMLRWVQKNIASFGGDPKDVTIAGASAGSSAVDLLMLSKMTKGLFNKVIPESGANTAAFSVQPDPIEAAKEYAKLLNYTGTDDIYELEEFFKSTSVEVLNSVMTLLSRTDATFLVGPCVERKIGKEIFLHDSPVNILKSGDYEKVPMLYGFASMEGLLRLNLMANDLKSDMERMDKHFSEYLPADLAFDTPEEREEMARKIKNYFFGSKVDEEDIIDYVNYFSDVLIMFSTLRSVKYHVEAGNNEIYLYEYSFTDENTPLVPFTKIRGATHCAQTDALWPSKVLPTPQNITKEYQEIQKILQEFWINFITTGKPVPEGSGLPEWPAVGRKWSPHMSLGRAVELRGSLLKERALFWEEIYARHYRSPQPPPAPPKRTEL
ncbi:juvenile hormone esterase-like [Aricia agestis]|uniref:juvenile hormone esterase-like n=1 Tax=Aricia agestis TaxID=91739 RepID=UPI001C203391|nr:juvenile hormone esterase-like [Aricia agestis]